MFSSIRRMIRREIDALTPFFERVVFRAPRGAQVEEVCPAAGGRTGKHQLTIFQEEIHTESNLLECFRELHARSHRTHRVLVVSYASWLKFPAALLRLPARSGSLAFPTQRDWHNLFKMSGWEEVRCTPLGIGWCAIPFVGQVLESVWSALPVLRWCSLFRLRFVRPILPESEAGPLGIVIPARNEKGNIVPALQRLAEWSMCPLEVVFVESRSNDGTWEEIQRRMPEYQSKFHSLRAFQIAEAGKAAAVRFGLRQMKSEVLTILDADLTTPPEVLQDFYRAYLDGHGDFVNGNRLLYPMEAEAMRPLNLLGNSCFALLLRLILVANISDSLCGTKLFRRDDYARFCRWNESFGQEDPFGDYELLFPAAILGLGIAEVPVRYLARQYGTTNIFRFRNGFELLRLMAEGYWRLWLRPK